MVFSIFRKQSLEQKRISTIIVSFPFLVATSVLLYRRLFLGEEQKRMPRPGEPGANMPMLSGGMGEGERGGEFGSMPEELQRRIREEEKRSGRI
ncbi:hypothetical protein AAT19DRAFT_12807 [Rhodotorula toruloides]|uniref:Uncharacterized protein n=1 Tax=Rhodotorula toruloides TaxID=5286 RepID=A0A2T0ACQ0_RHOTO|nr:hypothetical protein AAT19DRAFT_12807 [Rhodotorula toruloides]